MSVNDGFRIVIDDSTVMFQIVASLTDDFRGAIYNCKMFIVQATGPMTCLLYTSDAADE